MKESTQQYILGVCMLDGAAAVGKCIEAGVNPSWFSGKYQTCMEAAIALFGKGRPVDSWSILNTLGPSAPDVTSTELNRCIDAVTTTLYLPYYIEMARQEHALDEARTAYAEMGEQLSDVAPDAIYPLLADIQGRWAQIGANHRSNQSFAQVADALVKEWGLPKTEYEAHRVVWPLYELQNLIGVLDDEYVILGARPSIGKTAFVVQWMVELGRRDIKSSLASLESNSKRIARRAISYIGKLNTQHLHRKDYTPEEMEQAVWAQKELATLPLSVADNSMTIEQIRAFGMAEKAAGSRILFIDNSKHIRANKRYASNIDQFRDISLQCKQIRDDLRLPVVLLHHLNKELELSWSDDIERDADIIIRMAQNHDTSIEPTNANNWDGRCVVDLSVRKNRDGHSAPDSPISVEFQKKIQRFVPYQPEMREVV